MTARKETSAPTATPPPAARARHRRRVALGRDPGDAVRVALGTAVLSVLVLAVQRDRLSTLERDVFRLVNDLPEVLSPVMVTVMQLGNLVAGPALAIGALALRRARLALDFAVAGPVAWLAARVVKQFVERPRPGGLLDGVLRATETDGLGFVSGHATVAAALATVAGPYLSRRSRRLVWVVAWAVSFARVYTGAHLPLDVVGGAALGWAVGGLLHLVLGAPHGRLGADVVARSLRDSGLDVVAVVPAADVARSSQPFIAELADGQQLFVKVLHPDRRDADWLLRLARVLAFREVKDRDALASLAAQAEHEAAMALFAAGAGVRTPSVRLAVSAGESELLAQERVVGDALSTVHPGRLTSNLLIDVWQQVFLLHHARMAHRDLVAANVVVDDRDRTWLVDFGNAETGASERMQAADVAELLASLSCVVGVERAVSSARAVLGRAVLAGALAELQPLALSPATRTQLRGKRGLLEGLRAALADDVGPLAPEAGRVTVSAREVAGLVAAGVVVSVLLVATAGGSSVARSAGTLSWRWLGVGAVAAALAPLLSGCTLIAAVDRSLALGRTAAVEVAADAARALGGGPARRAVLLRYLERVGIDRRAGSMAVLSATAGGLFVSVAGAVVAVVLLLRAGHAAALHRPTGIAVLGFAALAGCLFTVIGRVRRTARDTTPGRRATVLEAAGALRRPMPAAGVISGAVAANAATVVALFAALEAFGVALPVVSVATVGLIAISLDSIGPLQGAPGLVDAFLAAGFLALGGSPGAVVAAVMVFRLLTLWLRVAVGAAVARRLERRLVL